MSGSFRTDIVVLSPDEWRAVGPGVRPQQSNKVVPVLLTSFAPPKWSKRRVRLLTSAGQPVDRLEVLPSNPFLTQALRVARGREQPGCAV
jgi:hypothetical protein